VLRITINAWVHDDAIRSAIVEGLSDKKLSRSQLDVQAGGISEAIQHYNDNPTPQLLILETLSEAGTVLEELDQLAEVCDAGTNVVLVGHSNDIALYRELIKRGVAEYLVPPIAPRDLFEVIAGIFIDPNAPPLGRMIAFMGSRGGCGSSTMAHNVGWYLADQFPDEDVTIVDFDLNFGTAALAFNVETQQTVDQILADASRLDDVLLERHLIEIDDNLRLLASPASLDVTDAIVGEAAAAMIDMLRRRSNFVVLDLPHQWTPWTQQMLLDADDAVITAAMDLPGLRDTKSLLDRLKQQRGESGPVHMVLNHEGAFKKTELSPKDFENATDLQPDVRVPHDPNLFGSAGNNGQMIGQVNAKNKASEAVRELAIRVSGKQAAIKKKKKVFSLNLDLMAKIKAK
jgi:pilus assembly protein CpaE